eukprot:m.32612 g.32612  ORF g.32612 m.32612 type:complete len:299 (+) comp4903_c0_seq1:43-939(+)
MSRVDRKRRRLAANFAASSMAPAISALVTNPIEVVKVRQQIDQRPGGMLGTSRHIVATEGWRGLQAGLHMAVVREASKAFFRIGLFAPLVDQLHDPRKGPAPLSTRMVAGMTSGAIAALVCNPIELVKTRQQGAAGGKGAAAFHYNGPIDGLRKLHAAEGVRGMWRGTGISMVRSAVVTGPHLTTYTMVKDAFIRNQWLKDSPPLHILASLAGGFTGILCNHPVDLIRNRLYNQARGPNGRGLLYSGAADCVTKLVRADGVTALYRGFLAHYGRVGPHYVITFTMLEQLRKVFRRWAE